MLGWFLLRGKLGHTLALPRGEILCKAHHSGKIAKPGPVFSGGKVYAGEKSIVQHSDYRRYCFNTFKGRLQSFTSQIICPLLF